MSTPLGVSDSYTKGKYTFGVTTKLAVSQHCRQPLGGGRGRCGRGVQAPHAGFHGGPGREKRGLPVFALPRHAAAARCRSMCSWAPPSSPSTCRCAFRSPPTTCSSGTFSTSTPTSAARSMPTTWKQPPQLRRQPGPALHGERGAGAGQGPATARRLQPPAAPRAAPGQHQRQRGPQLRRDAQNQHASRSIIPTPRCRPRAPASTSPWPAIWIRCLRRKSSHCLTEKL